MVKSNYQENKKLRKVRKQNKIKNEEEIIMAENMEMNAKLTDEEISKVDGGWNKDWWKKYSNTAPKINQYDLVRRKGYEQYGIAEVRNIEYFGRKNNGTFVYDIVFAGQPSSVTSGYGHNVPEKELVRI